MAVLQCQLFVVEGDADDRGEGQGRDHAARVGHDLRIEGPLDDKGVGIGIEGQDLFVAMRDDRDAVRSEPDLLHTMKKPRLEGGALGLL